VILPAGVTAAAYTKALADIRGLREYGTYRAKPEDLPPTQDPKCGSRTGYTRHRRRGERACEGCRDANTASDRRLRETGTSRAVTP